MNTGFAIDFALQVLGTARRMLAEILSAAEFLDATAMQASSGLQLQFSATIPLRCDLMIAF